MFSSKRGREILKEFENVRKKFAEAGVNKESKEPQNEKVNLIQEESKEPQKEKVNMIHEEKKEPQKSKASLILESIFATAESEIKHDYRILLLGGTGQGKTAFLNFLANA